MGILNEGNGGGFYMPVAPAGAAYGNGGGLFGGDGSIWGLLLVLLLCGNGMWGGFGGGLGGMMMPWMMGMGGGFGMDYLYPWLNNSQHISDGFRDQQLQTSIGTLQNTVTSGFGDVQLGIAGINQNICQTGNSITGAVRDGFYNAEIGANNRQMANMQQVFGLSNQLSDCCCENRLANCQTNNTIISEGAATRSAIQGGIQTIMDKLCDQELQAERRENANLRQELLYARGQASQTAQTVNIRDSIIVSINTAVYVIAFDCIFVFVFVVTIVVVTIVVRVIVISGSIGFVHSNRAARNI